MKGLLEANSKPFGKDYGYLAWVLPRKLLMGSEIMFSLRQLYNASSAVSGQKIDIAFN